ncbi:MAG: hypothetical protein NVS1B10_08660 [Candidatus Saccharimonadales bacterium]
MQKLSPAEQSFLLAYHESEFGGNGAILYADHEEVKRLWRTNKRQQKDSMNGAVHDLPLENRSGPGNVEDTMIAMLDGHELRQMKERAKVSRQKQDKAFMVEAKKNKRRRKVLASKKG